MNTNFLKSAALITGLMASSNLFAQDADYYSSIKPFAPAGSFRTWSFGVHGGALSPNAFYGTNDFSDPKIKIGYGGYIKKQILPAFGLKADFLRGQFESKKSKDGTIDRSVTNLNWSAALSFDFTIANVNWRSAHTVVRPYLTAGGGVLAYKPKMVRTTAGVTTEYGGDNNEKLYIPLGAGIKFGVAKGIDLDLGYSLNLVNGDDLDNKVWGRHDDKFQYLHLGLEFALGNSNKPSLANSNPVRIMYDDYVSRNEDLKSQLAAERANTAQQLAAMQSKLENMTRDSDGDGVVDFLDKCPDTPRGVKVDGSGCPLPEPQVPVRVYVTEEDRRVVKEAIDNLEFDFAKATIREKSFRSLNKVAELLINKNFSLKLAGHTDNVGGDAANMKLSRERAEAVKNYLVDKGANPSRIEAIGYGKTQPIATNATAAGRQENRRVEFTLY